MPPAADGERIERAARFLAASRERLEPFTPVPDAFAPRDAGEAYQVQHALQRLMGPRLGGVAGYKVALTTPVMQQMVGYGEPVPGAVFAATVHRSPSTVVAAEHTHLGIECELGVRLAKDLPAAGAPYDRDDAAGAVAAVMPAFELVDDRLVDYAHFAEHILSFIGDNAWNAGVVLGTPVTAWQAMDLAALHGVMSINGRDVGAGDGRDVMGHPLDALAWLANALAARGGVLSAGMLVMTGSIIATKFVQPGDAACFTLGEMAPVHVDVR